MTGPLDGAMPATGLCFNCQVEQRRQVFRSEIGLESSQEVL